MSVIQDFVLRANNSLRSRYKTFRVNQRTRWKQNRSRFRDLGHPQAVIWIFGCQRSGTTLLENIFRHDLDSVVYGEFGPLMIAPRKTVLTDLSTVRSIVQSQNAKYAVIRSLFESDRAIELMDLFPNSVGIWIFRDCPHVVDSMIRKWGDHFFEKISQTESDQNGSWRSEAMVAKIQAEILGLCDGECSAEAYARYWLERNLIPYRLGLSQDPRMLFISYRNLVSEPRSCLERILIKAGMSGVWKDFRADAHLSSLDRPVNVNIIPDTLIQCQQVYQSLLECSHNN